MLPSLRALIGKSLLPVLTLLALSAPSFAGTDKTIICHIPPDHPENVAIMELSAQAAAKHLERHGDRVYAPGEICDGIDNDCDREVDEDFPDKGVACTDGIGACESGGVKVCNQEGSGTVCSAVAGEPDPELCTGGIDEDCDGTVDCGDTSCDSDPACKIPVCGDGAVDPGEQCDDGDTDDSTGCCSVSCQITAGVECAADDNECTLSQCSATGVCEAQDTDGLDCTANGVDACSAADTCDAGACQDNGPNATPDLPCNGLDEDCDGESAGASGAACHSGAHPGVCAAGTYVCSEFSPGGIEVCEATIQPGQQPEDCGSGDGLGNGLDDDCDGVVDEGCSTPLNDSDNDGVLDCEDWAVPSCSEDGPIPADTSCDDLGYWQYHSRDQTASQPPGALVCIWRCIQASSAIVFRDAPIQPEGCP